MGKIVAVDQPDNLRASIGGDSITITSDDAEGLVEAIRSEFDIKATVVDGRVRIEHDEAGDCVAKLFQAFPDRIQTITLAKPTLEDVFIQKTGHQFWEAREVVA